MIQRRKEMLGSVKKESTNSKEFSKLQLQVHQKIFQRYEAQLDKGETGPTSNKSVAKTVKDALHYRDQSQYDLYAYCLMSNHVHLVFKLLTPEKLQSNDSRLSDYPVTALLKKLKSYTGVKANQVLERTGQFWHRESYDRVIRNSDELERTIAIH